jgi:hypothetical protein
VGCCSHGFGSCEFDCTNVGGILVAGCQKSSTTTPPSITSEPSSQPSQTTALPASQASSMPSETTHEPSIVLVATTAEPTSKPSPSPSYKSITPEPTTMQPSTVVDDTSLLPSNQETSTVPPYLEITSETSEPSQGPSHPVETTMDPAKEPTLSPTTIAEKPYLDDPSLASRSPTHGSFSSLQIVAGKLVVCATLVYFWH